MPARGKVVGIANFTPNQMKELIQGYREKSQGSVADSSTLFNHSRNKSQAKATSGNFHRSTKNHLRANGNGDSSADRSFDRAQQSTKIAIETLPKSITSDSNLVVLARPAQQHRVHLDVSIHGTNKPEGVRVHIRDLTAAELLTDKVRLSFDRPDDVAEVDYA